MVEVEHKKRKTMKKTIIFASVALATLFAFSSCQKESLENKYTENSVRVITATFENNGTKTTLSTEDNKTPLWKEGDIIRVFGTRASGNQYDDITLAAGDINNGGKSITFTTDLSGILYAVYPASATAMTSCNGSIDFTIPAVQDGTFASANICVAKSTATDGTNKDSLVFSNATAVLEIKTAANVVGVDITAANNIAGAVTASFSGNEIGLTPALTGKSISAVGTNAPSGNVFYLAVAPGATGSTTATCYTIDKKGSTNKNDKTLQRNVIYSMDLSSMTINTDCDLTGTKGKLNGHEYVIIKAKYDGSNDSYRKWATMNIGASSEADYGYYFFWGGIVGYVRSGSDWVMASNTSSVLSEGFSQNNDPHYDNTNSKYTKYTGTSGDNKPVLELADDAATANWGGSWRMPTKAEFDALCSLTKEWKTNYNWSGVNGCLFTDDNSNSIFLPAAGYGSDTGLIYVGIFGYYWSSSLASPDRAYYLDSDGAGAGTANLHRCDGQSVRALYEEPNYQ